MAAGQGVRMHSSTPKVLHRVAGVPMVSLVGMAARGLTTDTPVIVVSPGNREAVMRELGDGFEYVDQPTPLGTGHALIVGLQSAPPEALNVLLLNGDMPLITSEDLYALGETHIKGQAVITVGVATLAAEEATDLGTVRRAAGGSLVEIVNPLGRASQSTPTVEVAVGAFAINVDWARDALNRLPKHDNDEYFVTDLVQLADADGLRVDSVNLDSVGACIGVNTKKQLAKAEQEMQQRLRIGAMDAGVTMINPSTVYLNATVTLAADATILPNTALSGSTSIAEGAVIGPNAQITDSTVGLGAVIGSAVIRGSFIGAGAQVGPFTLIREGSLIAEGANIGAHVEIKASHIGKGSHIGHFSYVGDAVLGENVNIGAGTVTCNYDGTDKHVTTIGDRAFIGSGSMLVAPINIGADALTAAGAVVTKDVEPGGRVAGIPARQMPRRFGAAPAEEENSLG